MDEYPFLNVDERLKSEEWSLSLLTYADLCEGKWSDKKGMFLFIPVPFVRPAFKLMKDIFARQAKRVEFVKKNNGSEFDKRIVKDKVLFVRLLRGTLQKHLNCPVVLLTPYE